MKRKLQSASDPYHTCWRWMQAVRLTVPVPLSPDEMCNMLHGLIGVPLDLHNTIEQHNRITIVHFGRSATIKLEGCEIMAVLHSRDFLLPQPREYFIIPRTDVHYEALIDWVRRAREFEDKLQGCLLTLYTTLSHKSGVPFELAELLKDHWPLRVNRKRKVEGIEELLNMLMAGMAMLSTLDGQTEVRPATPIPDYTGQIHQAHGEVRYISWVE